MRPYVVGIGASAGGLAALRTLLSAMPAEPGFACVVVVHLSPDHESRLVELLEPYTRLRVQQVRSTTLVEPNNVYVIPPNANLEAIDTHVRLSDLEPRRAARAPINHFLRTLARVHDGHAVAVILTGSGSDGSLGLRQVKEAGGLTIAQDPEEAEYDSMPRSAIQTGAVDRVHRVSEIPGAIISFCAARGELRVRDDGIDPAQNEALDGILALILRSTGHDFGHFRRKVLLRRITRRMQLHRVATLAEYLDVLRSVEEEPRALCNDLLHAFTEFFDDGELFARLERDILPALFAEKSDPGSRVRVWSAGCSTGEEAYSLAMLLSEQVDAWPGAPVPQVFATDVSAESVSQAREAIYPHEVAATLAPDRLARFFVEEGQGYRVADHVRNLVVFAEHDVLRDPPYGHVDLILCRSLLSELRPDARRSVLGLFHYALEPGGRLVVGRQDAIDEPQAFEYEDLRLHVLRRKPGGERALAIPPYWRMAAARSAPEAPPSRAGPRSAIELAAVHYRMMERYTPPSLLVAGDDTVAHYSASAGRYVLMPGGEPTHDVHHLLREPLPSMLRPLLERTRAEAAVCTSPDFTVETESGPRRVALRVDPPAPDSGDLALVVIEERGEASDEPDAAQVASSLQADIDRIQQRLRSVIDAHAKDRGDLVETNDQLQSSNQELKFLLEQLEWSKEEVQAANEELTTLDLENRRRVGDLGRLSGDLRHLLESTGIAMLFLDRALRIVRYTPQLGELFNVRDVDIGRPVADIVNKLDYDDLVDDARRTLEHVTMVDREVHAKSGKWYLMRMLPYQAPLNRLEGVVLTFVDITDRKRAEQGLRDADRRKDEFLALLAHELRNPLAPIVTGIELLRQSRDKPQLLEQVTATMARQTRQLVRLVDDLLELSRVSGGRLRLRKARVLLRDIVRDAVASVRPSMDRQGHELSVTLPDVPIELEADGARLTQVLSNLLNNAARYTPDGGRIAIEAAREGREAIITVTDNGVGIPASMLTRIYEMFYQGDEVRQARGGGLGIGLTLARSLVEMHGGTIAASSAGPNRGSAFKIRLPLAERPEAGEGATPRAASAPLGGHRVLIVDDNTDAARTLGMLVESLGRNEVHVAYNGGDALRIAEECKPDIVLLDLKMPGMDGYEVARRLRGESWGRDLMIVALTGWALEDHKRRSQDAGFDRHLTKPADIASLEALLASRRAAAPSAAPPSG